MLYMHSVALVGVAQWRSHWSGKGGQSATPDSEKFAKNLEKSGQNQEKLGKKSGKIRKKEETSGRNGKNLEISFAQPLLTDRAGYATGVATLNLALPPPCKQTNKQKTLLMMLFLLTE